MPDDIQAAKKTLEKDFPDLEIKAFTFLGNGWNNIAYLVNNETVFRLPTQRDDVGEVRQQKVSMEVALLIAVYGKLSVASPYPIFVAPNLSYFGYKHLPGSNLEKKPELMTNVKYQSQFLQVWANTAAQIEKSIPYEFGLGLGLRPFDKREPLPDVVFALENHLIPAKAEYLARFYLEEYETLFDIASKRLVALHGDMGIHSWLVNKVNIVTALIDWTDACIGPIEHQLGCWPWEMSENLVIKAIEKYEEVTGYQANERLVYLEYIGNAIGDIGYLVQEGKTLEDPGIQHVLESVNYWANRKLLR